MVQKASTLSKSWPVLSGFDIHFMRCKEKANGFTGQCVAAPPTRQMHSIVDVLIQFGQSPADSIVRLPQR